MYQIFLGKISRLSGRVSTRVERSGTFGRAACQLACRARHALCCYRAGARDAVRGKWQARVSPEVQRGFSLSHSGDDIALLFSDERDVGCDIEVLRPRPNWPRLAEKLFSPGEQALIAAQPGVQQLAVFWRIWTIKEAIIKQRGESAWQMASIDSTAPSALSVSALQVGA